LEHQFKKVEFVLEKSLEHKVDFILHGGDFFDTYSPNLWIIAKVVQLLRQKNYPPVYVVPGNHDLFGNNIESLFGSGLNMLELVGVIRILKTIWYNGSIKIIPILPRQLYLSNFDISGDIYIIHNYVTLEPVPFEHVLCKTLDFMDGKLFLCGDFHYPFEYFGRSTFLNPGCLVRRSISERVFEPAFYIIDYPTDIKKIKVPCKNDFIIKPLEEKQFDFSEIRMGDFKIVDVKEIIKRVAQFLNISKVALERLLEKVDEYI
jgi:predicted phosphodiesterase